MARLRILSASEQVTEYLRDELRRGAWNEVMPGMDGLATELGVGVHTIGEALRQLEKEGLLIGQGHRRSRIIVKAQNPILSSLRLRILLYEDGDAKNYYMVDLLHQLREEGHDATFAPKTLLDLGMDPKRIARYVQQEEADAWVIRSAPSLVLEWFAEQRFPAFGMFGSINQVPLASISLNRVPAYVELIQQLVELGHRRIVFIAREDRRKPEPGFSERFYLSELERHGIQTGKFNLPDWGNSPEDFHRYLEILYAHTPPTALILDEPALLFAAQQYLARRGIRAPEDISLICTDTDKSFDWFRPTIAHIAWDPRPVMRRVLKWADNIALGKDDRRKLAIKATFIQGGTIGRAGKG